MARVTIEVPDSVNIVFGDYHKPVDVKPATLHANGLAKAFTYGLVQYVRDGAATMANDENGNPRPATEITQDKFAGIEKRLAALTSGDIPTGGGGARLDESLKEARLTLQARGNKKLAKAKSWAEIESALGDVATTMLREHAESAVKARAKMAIDLGDLTEKKPKKK